MTDDELSRAAQVLLDRDHLPSAASDFGSTATAWVVPRSSDIEFIRADG